MGLLAGWLEEEYTFIQAITTPTFRLRITWCGLVRLERKSLLYFEVTRTDAGDPSKLPPEMEVVESWERIPWKDILLGCKISREFNFHELHKLLGGGYDATSTTETDAPVRYPAKRLQGLDLGGSSGRGNGPG